MKLNAKKIFVGDNTTIASDAELSAINAEADEIYIGNNVVIDPRVRIRTKRVYIGDYTVIRADAIGFGHGDLIVGCNSWVASDVQMNATNDLVIGHGATLSYNCSIWTHFSGGDTLVGCRFDYSKTAKIGSDVWIGVGATIAPVNIGDKALILANAAITHDVPENTIWGGVPAKDLTEKLGGKPYVQRTKEAIKADFSDRLRSFYQKHPKFSDHVIQTGFSNEEYAGIGTFFNLAERTYIPTGALSEIAFMRFLLPQAKFIDVNWANKAPDWVKGRI